MPKCLVFIHQIEGLLLALSHLQLMRKERSKKYAGPVCPHLPPSIRVLMSTPEQNITFHCRSNTSPWIIFFSELRCKVVCGWVCGCVCRILAPSSLSSIYKKKRKEKKNLIGTSQFAPEVQFLQCWWNSFVEGICELPCVELCFVNGKTSAWEHFLMAVCPCRDCHSVWRGSCVREGEELRHTAEQRHFGFLLLMSRTCV